MTQPVNITHAYRHLYRNLMKAVSYARPARFIARDALRSAFRTPQPSTSSSHPDAERIKRTLWFLQGAARERGLEHSIVKNLVEVWGRRRAGRGGYRSALSHDKQMRRREHLYLHERSAYHHYDMTVAMLNETMGLCLPLK